VGIEIVASREEGDNPMTLSPGLEHHEVQNDSTTSPSPHPSHVRGVRLAGRRPSLALQLPAIAPDAENHQVTPQYGDPHKPTKPRLP
jgi:hypothetical protein